MLYCLIGILEDDGFSLINFVIASIKYSSRNSNLVAYLFFEFLVKHLLNISYNCFEYTLGNYFLSSLKIKLACSNRLFYWNIGLSVHN
jgi:hypothetical protein